MLTKASSFPCSNKTKQQKDNTRTLVSETTLKCLYVKGLTDPIYNDHEVSHVSTNLNNKNPVS